MSLTDRLGANINGEVTLAITNGESETSENAQNSVCLNSKKTEMQKTGHDNTSQNSYISMKTLELEKMLNSDEDVEENSGHYGPSLKIDDENHVETTPIEDRFQNFETKRQKTGFVVINDEYPTCRCPQLKFNLVPCTSPNIKVNEIDTFEYPREIILVKFDCTCPSNVHKGKREKGGEGNRDENITPQRTIGAGDGDVMTVDDVNKHEQQNYLDDLTKLMESMNTVLNLVETNQKLAFSSVERQIGELRELIRRERIDSQSTSCSANRQANKANGPHITSGYTANPKIPQISRSLSGRDDYLRNQSPQMANEKLRGGVIDKRKDANEIPANQMCNRTSESESFAEKQWRNPFPAFDRSGSLQSYLWDFEIYAKSLHLNDEEMGDALLNRLAGSNERTARETVLSGRGSYTTMREALLKKRGPNYTDINDRPETRGTNNSSIVKDNRHAQTNLGRAPLTRKGYMNQH